MECTSIKFELFWRKISRKDGCKGVSENARIFHIIGAKYRLAPADSVLSRFIGYRVTARPGKAG